jgi:hypothetical protein
MCAEQSISFEIFSVRNLYCKRIKVKIKCLKEVYNEKKERSGRRLLLGINLGHWQLKLVYLLIFAVVFSSMYFRFHQVQTNYWGNFRVNKQCAMNCSVRFPVIN